ncbi:IclR family transcriptional regulator [Brevibacillus panacihumi W25]|uniref:IclR family transcriptional regulator n=1 Tax=Brevibacillus panacihumi W25 TaxID=1408254 RepID=V6M431_9BACL|nr:IclR family transcriptional regulator [Brevibacillus panacihumi]EST53386.1 IclR family transcriptional regulator [Brevibacillus panacihumi W25]
MSKPEKDRYLSNSLIRGLEILRMFDASTPTLSLVEIAAKMGVSRTVPFRFLYTLQYLGYLYQDEVTKRYQLTPKVMDLGFAYLNTMQLPDLARPYLEKLRDQTGASAHMGILDGNEVVYVARAATSTSFSTLNVMIGSRLPAHATSMGKVLLAFLSEEKLQALSENTNLPSFTTQTKTMLLDLKKELEEIRKKGYAISKEEFEIGICSVAVPIFDRDGGILAAINVAAPTSVLNPDMLESQVVPVICETAKALSGYAR